MPPRFLSPTLLPVSKRWGPFSLTMDTRTTLPPTLTVSPWSRPSLPPTSASTVCSPHNSLISASKTSQAIPSQTLERKGLPSGLLNLPPRSHPPSGPLSLASSVPPTQQVMTASGLRICRGLHLPTTFLHHTPHSLQVSVRMSPQTGLPQRPSTTDTHYPLTQLSFS